MRVETSLIATEAEKGVLSALVLAPTEVFKLCAEANITSGSFVIQQNVALFEAITSLIAANQTPDFITIAERLRDEGVLEKIGGATVSELFTFLPSPILAGQYVDILATTGRQRNVSALLARMTADHASGVPLNGKVAELRLLLGEGRHWKKELDLVRFDAAHPPHDPPAIYTLQDAKIGTSGNIIALQAQAKAGKTAFLGGMIGSTLGGEGDNFGIRSGNLAQMAVLHFDTEQSPADHHRVIQRALARAGAESAPDWLRSYCLTGMNFGDRNAALRYELERAAAQCRGLHSVFVDGIGDLVADPNDPAEAFRVVDEFHQLAIRFKTVFILVLHENPGSEIGKTRGHLGSQLERKAETNLRLSKNPEGVTVIYSERARHCHIPKSEGPQFQWNEIQQKHVSCETGNDNEKYVAGREKSRLADEIWAGIPKNAGLSWTHIRDSISESLGITPNAARKRLDAMVKCGVLRYHENKYYYAE